MKINIEKEWLEFSLKVRNRDNNCCAQCKKSSDNIRLSVYRKDLLEEQKSNFKMEDYHSLCSACVVINKLYKELK